MSKQLTILKTAIRTLDGLFSLNDLHKASGENPSQRPSLYIRNNQTKDLISEIEKDQSTNLCLAQKSIRGGLNAGVWACEELALAYATWISPKFHLVVLRAFIAMHKGENLQNPQPSLPLAENPDNLKTLLKLLSYAKNWQAFQKAIATGDTKDEQLKKGITTLYSRYNDNYGVLTLFA